MQDKSHIMKTDYKSFGRVEQFEYTGRILINQIAFIEEIKSRLKSGNACYYSVQNLLSSSLLSKTLTLNLLTTTIVAPSNAGKWQMGFNSAFKGLKVHIYRNIILLVVLYGCETWSFT